MATREQVEGYLLQAGLDHEEIGEGMWLAGASAGSGIVIHFSHPLLVFRMKVMDLPADEPRCAQLYRRLLELNATDLVHAAYALEEGDVILTATLAVENLDFNEFQATIDSFQVALASHLESLAEFRDCAPAQA